ncbi:MAG: methyltransferase domain-containing protein [Planctomycetota bacterium]
MTDLDLPHVTAAPNQTATQPAPQASGDDEVGEILRSARAAAGEGEIDLALIEYGRALRRTPRGHRARAAAANDVGALRFTHGRPDLALPFLKAAVEAAPDDEVLRGNLEHVRSQPAAAAPKPAVDDPGGAASVGDWVLQALSNCEKLIGFQGRHVLEIGGELPRLAAQRLRPASWTSVDPAAEPVDLPRHRALNARAEDVPFDDATFDLAFSCCAFEHVDDLDGVIAETRRVLRPGGVLFAEFSPIWSSATGNHVWLAGPGGGPPTLTFEDGVLPRWAHLIWEPEDLAAFVEPSHGPEEARRAANNVYEHWHLNRLFEDDYLRAFHDSGLVIERLQPHGATQKPTPKLAERLRAANPGREHFSSAGFLLVARKPR